MSDHPQSTARSRRWCRARGGWSRLGLTAPVSIHIAAQPGDIAETVLFPGDPLRAQWIAETFFTDPTCYSQTRNMLGFTGDYKGQRVFPKAKA